MKSTRRTPPILRRLALGITFAALAVAPHPARAASRTIDSGTKAHYVVFTLDESGAPVPMSHQIVDLPALTASTPRDLEERVREAPRGSDAVVFRLVSASGATVYEDAVLVDRDLRLEEGLHGGPAIETRQIEPLERAFVVRVPVSPGSRLVVTPVARDAENDAHGMSSLRARGAAPAEFDLAELEESTRLPLSRFSTTPTLSTTGGGSANRMKLLVMGDGYTSAERPKFDSDAASLVDRFFSISPLSEYRRFVEVTTLFTPSAQSGATHPAYQAGCAGKATATCCADLAAKRDPLQGTYVTTAFNATFCSQNVHRLLVVDTTKVLTAAAAAPAWDRILVLVNDATYGGSGGSVAVASLSDSAAGIAQHEFMHSFAGLADEYDAVYPGYPACSDVWGGPACEPNVTDQTSPSLVKWASWIRAGTPIPTPLAAGSDVGLFEGARYRSSGLYRPQHDCLMRTLGAGLCRVCAQHFVRTLYRGGWGTPRQGIDAIEPGTESPSASTVTTGLHGVVPFSVDLLQPAGGTVEAVWTVNGEVAGTGPAFRFDAAAPGTYTVRVVARDESPFVKDEVAGADTESVRSWTVIVKRSGSSRRLPSL